MHDHVTRVSPVVGAGGPCAVRFGDDPVRRGPEPVEARSRE